MVEKISNWFIKRELKKRRIHVDVNDESREGEFRRVLNTLRENKVMVIGKNDGVYIRLAGNRNNSETFTYMWAKVIDFNNKK